MNKQKDLAGAVALLQDGMSIGIGGWGARRKPMALIRAILRSDLKDLTLVGFGGPEMGMLCAAGKVRRLVYGFVSLDAIPLEPWFRKAREAGEIEVEEWDEGLFILGLRAAAENMPFAATRLGLGTDCVAQKPRLRMIRSPYGAEEHLLAMPALKPDVTLLHVSRADRRGNTQTEGRDPYFDAYLARAAGRVIVSAEEVTERLDLSHPEGAQKNLFDRYLVDTVVEAPCGAHPTTLHDAYGWDMPHLQGYCARAAEPDGWARYREDFLAGGEDDYLRRIGGAAHVAALPIPRI